MTNRQPIERVFDAAGTDHRDWTAIGWDASTGTDVDLYSVYFDTPDLALLRNGVTLRHRRGGDPPHWTLMLPTDAGTRAHIEVAGDRDAIWLEHPPLELLALVRAFTRGRQVTEVATLSTTRHRTQLQTPTGVPLAEIGDDLVSAVPIGSTTPIRWHEIDVEFDDDASPATITELEEHLIATGHRPRKAVSKLAAAFADRLGGTSRPEKGGKRRTAGAVVVVHLREQSLQLTHTDPLVRLQRADAIHAMRVCCRSLRSVLQAFPAVLDPARTEHLVEELRALGAVLGQARDIEVLRRRLTAAAETAAGGPDGLPAHLDDFLHSRWETAEMAVLEFLDSERYLDLLAALDALLETPPFTAAAWRPAAEVLPDAVTATAARVGRSLRRAARHDADRDRDLHAARKAAKRLRYAAAAAAPTLPRRRGARLVEAAHRLQDVLGERQDAVIARPLLRELAAAATSGAEGFVCGVLHEREAAHVVAAEQGLDAAWHAVRRNLP